VKTDPSAHVSQVESDFESVSKAVAAVNFNSTVQMHSCRACGHPP
jgi:hypothetical protein